MDFIFNINTGEETDSRSKDFEEVLDLMETHFEDWQNFYQLYKMIATPPTENAGQIQAWFKELQTSFIKIVEKYNNKVNKFADIVETNDDTAQELMNSMLNKDKKKNKKETDFNKRDDMNYMWG
tara:strand:- start:2391 stop:2762 length:372 start_codon:yes stop_codon:yes gene_type:complete